ncbi:hypothetical protein [Apilactobacillus apinorum]|nr:hypothetical protein [Apilactobacillus apinorum]
MLEKFFCAIFVATNTVTDDTTQKVTTSILATLMQCLIINVCLLF